jgi:hypothetical protein
LKIQYQAGRLFDGKNKGCVTPPHGLAIYIKTYLNNAKEEFWKFKYFTMQKYNLKETKILQDQSSSRASSSVLEIREFKKRMDSGTQWDEK